MGELLPIVLAQQTVIPDLGDELLLDSLQSIYGGPVPGGPQLAAVVQSWLDEASEKDKH